MGRKSKPYSDKSAPYATMASKPDDYLYKKGKKQKLVGSADNSPEDGEEELEESGYRYERDEEVEFDGNNSKIWHYLITPDGERFTINHSPYQEISPEEFDKYVEEFRRSSLKETNMTDELNELRKAAGLPIKEGYEDFEPATNMCPECEGVGEVAGKACEQCHGEGEIFEDCDQSKDAEKNDDGDCSPFTHADENVDMVREDDLDEVQTLPREIKNRPEIKPDWSGVEYETCSDCGVEGGHAEGCVELANLYQEGEMEEDFLAPPTDVEDGAYDTDETNLGAFDS